MVAYLNSELDKLKTKLMSSDISVVQKVQGEAHALQRTIDVLTNARKIGT